MVNAFKQNHNAIEIAQTIYYVKDESAVNHSTVKRWFKKFRPGYKNLDNQAKSGRPKTVDSVVVLKAMEANSTSSTWRLSGELGI